MRRMLSPPAGCCRLRCFQYLDGWQRRDDEAAMQSKLTGEQMNKSLNEAARPGQYARGYVEPWTVTQERKLEPDPRFSNTRRRFTGRHFRDSDRRHGAKRTKLTGAERTARQR